MATTFNLALRDYTKGTVLCQETEIIKILTSSKYLCLLYQKQQSPVVPLQAIGSYATINVLAFKVP